MKTIQRNIPPACLDKQPESQQWDDFAGTSCHTEIRNSLTQEQCGLCCYCESPVNDGVAHIEHMEPRKKNQKRTYDYANLALSCNGGNAKHCGHFKDDKHRNPDYEWDHALFSSPHDPATSSFFIYLLDGSIIQTSVDEEKSAYMIGYLGLNCSRLTDRRHQHARDLIDTMGEEPDTDIVTWLRKEYLQPDAFGHFQQFYSLSKAILEP